MNRWKEIKQVSGWHTYKALGDSKLEDGDRLELDFGGIVKDCKIKVHMVRHEGMGGMSESYSVDHVTGIINLYNYELEILIKDGMQARHRLI